jgi:hypothetical protein
MTGFPFNPATPGVYITGENSVDHLASIVGDATNGSYFTLKGVESTNFRMAGNNGGDRPYYEMYGIDSLDAGGGNFFIPATVNLSVNSSSVGNDFGVMYLNNTKNNSLGQFGFIEGNNNELSSRLLLTGNSSENVSIAGSWSNPDLPEFRMSGID